MSRLIATTADEMLSGANSSVMGMFWKNDDEVPGVVVLASANMMPNPDLKDLNERSRLRAWYMDAPPSPDSWNVYMRQTKEYNLSGNQVLIQDGPPMLRQNTSLLRIKQHTYQQDHALLTDKSLPDLSKDEDSDNDLAPPLDKPRIEKKTRTGGGGYPAGTLWFSYAGILGSSPHSSKRITNAAPAVKVTGITQGQKMIFHMPDEIPDSWSGVAFLAGDSKNTLRVQLRVDVRGRVVTDITDNGPYRRDGTLLGATEADNKTKMGDFKQLSAPKHWRVNGNQTLKKGNYPLAYQLKTDQGWTASSDEATVKVTSDQKGEKIAFCPHDSALKKPGIQRWRPLFKAWDDHWYTFEDAKENGYPLSKVAHIHTRNTSDEKWRSSNSAKKTKRSEKDSSGVPGPTDPMEPPTPTGAEQMAPGKYVVRVTTSSSKLGMESRPSPRKTFTLTETSAGSGVTNQLIRVFRPPGQTIRNSRLVEVDPTVGTASAPNTELHWDTTSLPSPAGGSVSVPGDGTMTVTDTTADTNIRTYRRSAIEPVDATKFYSVRYRMNVTTYGNAAARPTIALRFWSGVTDPTEDAPDDPAAPTDLVPNAVLGSGSIAVGQHTSAEAIDIKRTFGPAGSSANIEMPAGTAFVQLVVASGVTGQTVNNNHVFTLSNMGIYVGRSHPRKVYDLTLAEDTDPVDSWPVLDQEGHAEIQKMHYPHGPYIRVLQSPINPPKHRTTTTLETQGFGTWSTDKNGWATEVQTGNATFIADAAYALYGLGGVKLEAPVSPATTAGFTANTWKSFLSTGRTTFGLEAYFRVQALPSTGVVTLVGVTRAADSAQFLAYAELTSAGVLNLRYYNGTTMATTAVPSTTVQAGDDLRLDFTFTGIKTGSTGAVTLRVKRNDRDPQSATASAQPWSTFDAHRVVAGFFAPTLGTSGTAGATAKILMDRIRPATSGFTEAAALDTNVVEYWAPEKQPAGDPDHFLTGVRFPVKPGTTYVDSFYLAHDGVTTPSDGAKFFRVVSYNSDGEMLVDHGYILEGVLGKSHWDRYWMSYTTPSIALGDEDDAAYVEYTRNHIGDGIIWAAAFQHEVGTTPTAFDNTNALSGSFNVVFETPIKGGPLGGDTSFTKEFTRMRAIVTRVLDANGDPLLVGGLDQVTLRVRGAGTVASLSSAPWKTDVTQIDPQNKYVEVEVTMRAPSNTTSPEVRSVFVDAKRVQPVLTHEDGRDFWGGILVYALTPASPIPNVVRSEFADGSVGLKNVGRNKPPERLKLSLEALTEAGKRGVEKNPATDNPLFGVETDDTRYRVGMLPEFTGNIESRPDGTYYWDYTADDIVADVFSTEDY